LLSSHTLRRTTRWSGLTLAGACLAALPLLLTAGPASSSSINYVALGDSYSSGLGSGSYGNSGSCDVSSVAYPQLWVNANAPASFSNVTCAGATTSDVVNSEVNALSASTNLVSITIGGNDVGFSGVMETCVLESTNSCISAVDAAETKANTTLPGELDSAYSAISAHAPNARVVVLSYTELYDLSQSSGCIGLSTSARTALNQGADELNAQVQAAAARHGFVYVSMTPYFAGHLICDSDSWLHSTNFLDPEESYHPTATGQADGYYPAISAAA
jgi:lysophospholipase L1-like esterase